MNKYNIDFLKNNNLLIFEGIAGSHAYGTNTEASDIDKKGIFIMPKNDYYGFDYCEQVNDDRYDIVYYELKKFFQMLIQNNPNIIELIATPEDCILLKTPLFSQIKAEYFLSKLCKFTFAGYAMQQIKKAQGDNKKVMNPMPKEKKTMKDFCYIIKNNGSLSLNKWLEENSLDAKYCGLSKIDHMRDIYLVYYDSTNSSYNGISDQKEDNIQLSSIPKDNADKVIATMYYNEDGYKIFCKKYKEYWSWVDNRNTERYNNNIFHGKDYDSKNMSHCFRLLDEAEKIAREGIISIRSENIEFLLKVKRGEYEYDYLVKLAEERINQINILFDNSSLPDKPDYEKASQLLVEIRKEFYKSYN